MKPKTANDQRSSLKNVSNFD